MEFVTSIGQKQMEAIPRCQLGTRLPMLFLDLGIWLKSGGKGRFWSTYSLLADVRTLYRLQHQFAKVE